MKSASFLKYLQFLLIVLAGIAADQWTKWYAEDRLASQRIGRSGSFTNFVELEVPPEAKGLTVEEYLATEFTWSTPEEIETIAARSVRQPTGEPLDPHLEVVPGQEIHVTRREVVIVPDYWDFQYTRNPGAAFGFLADSESPYRTPFFVGISVLALVIILFILRGVPLHQQILVWGLSLIAAGAAGNFIDRVRFGYVIDFIVWKYTDEYRWPTFNIADALICIGVALMLIEIIRDSFRAQKEVPA